MQMLKPNDKQTIEELQRWLLMSKRTQSWDTPVNTVDAVYAFMKGNESNWNRKAENAVLKLEWQAVANAAGFYYAGLCQDRKGG